MIKDLSVKTRGPEFRSPEAMENLGRCSSLALIPALGGIGGGFTERGATSDLWVSLRDPASKITKWKSNQRRFSASTVGFPLAHTPHIHIRNKSDKRSPTSLCHGELSSPSY